MCCSTEKPADTVTFIIAAVVVPAVILIAALAFVAYKKKKGEKSGCEKY